MSFSASRISTSNRDRNPRSDFGRVSLAFRSRFACKWNAELTISRRVIGIFRARFACLQNSPFRKSFYRRDAGKKRVQEPGKQIPDAGVSGSKARSLTVVFLPASLRVSGVKLFIDLSKSARNKRAKRPASDEVNANRRSNKYQLTRNSQLSAFGLSFQVSEMYELKSFASHIYGSGIYSIGMKQASWFAASAFVISGIFVVLSCSESNVVSGAPGDIIYVASTPCEDSVKQMLTIPLETKCDFIRWNLSLAQKEPRTFALDINFGEGQPNTLGFWNGGVKLSMTGKYQIEKSGKGSQAKEVYRLKGDKSAVNVSLLKLNDNLFQLLAVDNTMMVNTGGWSYTINRRDPDASAVNPIFLLDISPDAAPPNEETFVGRTPCREIEARLGRMDSVECFKLKWKLTLYRDPTTHRPTTYTLNRTAHRTEPITGKWTITRTGSGQKASIVYQLDPDRPDTSLSFLLAENRLLFFLDPSGKLLTGNADFSYTLNKKAEQP